MGERDGEARRTGANGKMSEARDLLLWKGRRRSQEAGETEGQRCDVSDKGVAVATTMPLGERD